MDLSNRKSFAGSGLVAGICLIAGSLAGHQGIAVGVAMLIIFGVWYVRIELEGPADVSVRFGDSPDLSPWKKLFIKRTINRFYIHLRNAGLNPPVISPVINVGSHPELRHIGGMSCMPEQSEQSERSTLDNSDSCRIEAIARAYSWCYFMRKTGALRPPATADDALKYDGRLTALQIVSSYFYKSFANVKFLPYSNGFYDRWVGAMLSMRLDCGSHFMDGAVANVIQILASFPSNKPENHEQFPEWFWLHLRNRMFFMVVPGNTEKLDAAMAIAVDRGLISNRD